MGGVNSRRRMSHARTNSRSVAAPSQEFRVSGGGYFHNEEFRKYPFPIDDDEVDRQQLYFYCLKFAWQCNFMSPVQDKLSMEESKVLDIGCGPGTWVLEMASEFPNTHFTGMDCDAVFPLQIRPANVCFRKADARTVFPFPDNTFDFVHMSHLYMALTAEEWTHVIYEMVRVTKPGGCLEFLEPESILVDPTPTLHSYSIKINALAIANGFDLAVSTKLPEMLHDVPEIDNTTIQHRTVVVPIGPWGGQCGMHMQTWSIMSTKKLDSIFGTTEEIPWARIAQEELDQNHCGRQLHRVWAKKRLPMEEN